MVHDSGDENRQVVPNRSAEAIVGEIIEVERARIDRDNRRTALMERTLDIADTKDKRQFEFASQTRDAEISLRKARLLGLLRTIVWAALGLGSVVVLSLLGFVFFGNENQRATAAVLVNPALIGLAGYGVIATLTRVPKVLTNQ